MPAGLPGAHRSRQRGTTGEFTEYRPYRQGDEPRRIDWRLLARSDRAFVRLADDHALLPTVLVVDATASMAFPEDTRAKWRLARDVALGCAAVSLRMADPVGLVTCAATGARRLAPRSRAGTLGELARTLDEARLGGSASLAGAVGAVAPGARLVIVSDFLGDADDARRAAAAHVAAGGEVHAVHVVSEEELSPPAGVLAVDPEDEETARPLLGGARAEYLARFAEWRAELARAWREAGAAYVQLVTDERPAAAVRRVVGGPAQG